MPKYTVTAPDGSKWNVNAPDGASQDEVINYAKEQWSAKSVPSEPIGQRMNRELDTIPHQLGLTARVAIEGPMEMAGIFSNPIAYGLSKLTGKPVMSGGEMGSYFADKLGLPTPQNQTERVVAQGSKLMAGIGWQAALASKAAQLPGVAGQIYGAFAKSPTSQLTGASTGGMTGQYVKEEGGGPGAQFVGAMAGGFTGAAAPNVAKSIYNGVKSLGLAIRGTKASIDNISAQLDRILKPSGVTVKDLSVSTRNQILGELKKASDTGKMVDDAAIRRLADYDLIPGTIPRRGTVTLDPVQITQEKNLAKAAANSQDPKLNELARIPRNNDIALTNNLNELGAARAPDAYATGQGIKSAMLATDAPRKAAVDAAYKAVRSADGRYANIDVPAFSAAANNALDEQQLGRVLPETVKNMLNDISSGKIPLNVNTMNQLDSVWSGLARKAGNGSPEALAINTVRNALRESPVESAAGQKAIELYNTARTMARQRFAAIERNPAMQAALDDAAPDKFVQTYILGSGSKSNVRDVEVLVKDLKDHPEVFQSARDQILAFLKSKALNGNADEVGNFSPSAYNKALAAIGDRKLSLFFGKDLKQLKAIGRVASYEKFQPTGSAVNNSNTTSAAAGLMERIAQNKLVQRIPFGDTVVSNPLQSWSNQINAGVALNPAGGLLKRNPKSLLELQPGLSMLMPGLLGLEQR